MTEHALGAGASGPYRLLVVDDDAADLANVRQALARGGVAGAIDGATDAVSALDKIPRGGYDCILLDHRIPRVDGLTLLHGIRAAGLDVPVLMLTDGADDPLTIDLLMAGATDYIAKDGLDPERLASSLRHSVALAAAHRETRRAEAELRASAERQRLAAESAGVGMYDLDAETRQFVGTDRLAAIFGFAPGDRPNYDDYLSRIHLDDREAAARARAEAMDPVGEGHYLAEYRVVPPGDAVRWVDARGRVFFTARDGQRRAVRMVGTVLDITARKRAEEALREEMQLVETLHRIGSSVAADLELAHVVQTITDEATALTRARLGVFVYTTIHDGTVPRAHVAVSGAVRPDDAAIELPDALALLGDAPGTAREGAGDELLAAVSRMLERQTIASPIVSSISVPVRSHTGTVHGRLILGHPAPGAFAVRDERLVAGIAGWAALAMDNALLYAAAQRARADAERASRVNAGFLAMMSHEIRTPLNAIAGYAQLLIDDVPNATSPQHKEYARAVQRSERHLVSLIDSVLAHAKLKSGRVRYWIEDVPLPELLLAVESLVAPQLRAKSLHYSSAGCDRELVLRADREKAAQILVNLLSNAVKFTPPGGRIALEAHMDGDDRARLTVRDSGIGIPTDKLTMIFEPYVQVDGGRATGQKGTGLGLTISRELARGMRGDLRAEGGVGAGAVFVLTLPGFCR
jgi:signal transduction histidine kinase/DNA-binding response OmpR family regulator